MSNVLTMLGVYIPQYQCMYYSTSVCTTVPVYIQVYENNIRNNREQLHDGDALR